MANITLLGASYTDVPAVDLPKTGGGTVRFYENGGGSTPQKVSGSFELDTSGKTITIVHNLGVVPTFAQIYATSELSYSDWGTTYISYTSGIPTERVGSPTIPNTYKVLREERDASTSRYVNNSYSARDSISENEVVFSGRVNFFAGTYHYDILA